MAKTKKQSSNPQLVSTPKTTAAKLVNLSFVTETFKCGCGCETRTVFGELPSTTFNGILTSGQRYTAVTRQRVKCSQCGQVSVQKTFEFDPTAWK